MANTTTKQRKSSGSQGLPIIHRNAAGIDIGSTFHVVCVPADSDDEPVRRFDSFTGDLYRLAQWLKEVGITTVAMESTGIYWVPVYEILEERGFEVVLVNARDAHAVPREQDLGRKGTQLTSTTFVQSRNVSAAAGGRHCGQESNGAWGLLSSAGRTRRQGQSGHSNGAKNCSAEHLRTYAAAPMHLASNWSNQSRPWRELLRNDGGRELRPFLGCFHR